MESSLVKITNLYEKYKSSPNTIQKLEYYLSSQLPSLLDKYYEHEKQRIFLEKESKKYINNFLTDPQEQFFYISATDIFIIYDGENYQFINEDDLWIIILNDITEKGILIEWKQKIKNTIIKNIKEQNLFNTIPESATVQYVINFFTPTLFNTKEDVKHFLALIGDNILNKKLDLHYFVPIQSKLFFDTLESMCHYNFKNKLNITSSVRYRYRGEDYLKSRIIYFTKSIQNKSCWLSFLKDNLFNFLVVCCHYSTRYINADKYVDKRNSSFKNNIFYLKNNTKYEFIDKFIIQMTIKEEAGQIRLKDMFYLWKIYLKQNSLPNMIYKAEFENILREKIENNNSFFTGIKSHYLNNTKLVQKFWNQSIIKDNAEELEISELHTLINKWSQDTNNILIAFSEDNLQDIIEHFYDDVTIENEKFLIGISCNFWNKQGDMLDAFQHRFNKTIDKDITIYESYVMFCKYINNKDKILTVSKKYYYKYIDKVIPEQYIKDGRILLTYWNN